MKIMIDKTQYMKHILELLNDKQKIKNLMDCMADGEHSHFRMGFTTGLAYAAALTAKEQEYYMGEESSIDTESVR